MTNQDSVDYHQLNTEEVTLNSENTISNQMDITNLPDHPQETFYQNPLIREQDQKTSQVVQKDIGIGKKILDQIVKIHVDEIIRLRDELLNEQDEIVFDKKSKIIFSTIDFFKSQLKGPMTFEELIDNDSNLAKSSNKNSDADSDSSSETTEYSNTESEYNFDETDTELKDGLNNVMDSLCKELKKRENYECMKIYKKREYT